MPAQRYSQYFNIDEKYYAVVTKKLIDDGKDSIPVKPSSNCFTR